MLLQGNSVYAQRDFVILHDTLYQSGIVQKIPKNNTSILFKKASENKYVEYTVKEVSRYSHTKSVYYARTIDFKGIKQSVFLELIYTGNKDLKLWRLNQRTPLYFLEEEKTLHFIGKNADAILYDLIDDQNLSLLIARTKVNEHSLKYLLKSASKKEDKPRTFTNTFVITPLAGVGHISHSFEHPISKEYVPATDYTLFLGINMEVFLNFRKNISFNFSPQWFQSQHQSFGKYRTSRGTSEADVFYDYSALQLPFMLRYYHDVRPNSFRMFGDIGYISSKLSLGSSIIHEALWEGNTITTTTRNLGFSMPSKHQGFTLGLGGEKYLKGHRGVVMGIKFSFLQETLGSTITQNQIYTGYKF